MDTKQIRLNIYQEECKKLQTYVNAKWENDDLKNFHFLSANLSKFLPNISENQHKKAYHDILSFRTLQGIDTQFYESSDAIEDFGLFEETMPHLPAIFVSFHIGSYRSSLALLIKRNINVVLVVDPLAYTLQKGDILNQYEKLKIFFCSNSDLIIIPADQKDLAVQMLAKTKKGYSVLAFIDGNNGFNGSFNQDKSVKVEFCGHQILVRQGLAMLSYITKCPIVPIISYYENYNQRWVFHSPIYPKTGIDAKKYAVDSLQEIYSILESYVLKHPFQWDGWLYIHKFLSKNDSTSISNTSMKGNDNFIINKKIGLFSYDGKYYVINKSNYKTYQLNRSIFSTLKSTKRDEIIIKRMIPPLDLQSLMCANIILKRA
jgi:lauroyl/myristoyl acyltransferase